MAIRFVRRKRVIALTQRRSPSYDLGLHQSVPAASQRQAVATTLVSLSYVASQGVRPIFHMNDKHLQAFALAYLIGWLLSRMPKKN